MLLNISQATRHYSSRSSRIDLLLLLLLLSMMMLPLGHGFLTRYCRSKKSSVRPSFSKFDDLMDEVLSNRGGTTEPAAAGNSNNSTAGWRRIDWNQEQEKYTNEPPTQPSPVEVVMIRDRLVYIKRDDQSRLPGSQISGNKARKMLALQRLEPSNFPSCVVSFGGPQSNAMLALAAVVHYQNTLQQQQPLAKKKRFVYYTKKLPRFLRNQPSGNLFRATLLGMELVELSSDDYSSLLGSEWGGRSSCGDTLDPPVPGDSVWIPQGGACGMAVAGTRALAQEILDFWTEHGAKQPLSVCIPGGTCSTAVLVHRALKDLQANAVPDDEKLDIEVVVIPCVGDEAYARRQMMCLNSQVFGASSPSRLDDIPAVLRPTPLKTGQRTSHANNKELSEYFRFGEPDASILCTFRELRDEHDLVLDLLYGAPAWTVMFRHWTSSSSLGAATAVRKFDPDSPMDGRRIMYVHSGGLEGINSQMLRYKYKNLIDMDEIQLPGRSSRS